MTYANSRENKLFDYEFRGPLVLLLVLANIQYFGLWWPSWDQPASPKASGLSKETKNKWKNDVNMSIWRTLIFFELRLDPAAFLSQKSFQKWSFEPPLGTPYFRVMGGPKCSRYCQILTFLTFGHFWEELGRRRILTVFRPTKNTIFMKTWGEFDGNHNCFFIISKTTFFETHKFQMSNRHLLDFILGTQRHQKQCKSHSFFLLFCFCKKTIFWSVFEDPLKSRKSKRAFPSRP